MRGLKPSVIFHEAIARLRGTPTPPPESAPAPAPVAEAPTRRMRTSESEAVYIDDVAEVNDFVDHALAESTASTAPITETEIEIVEDTDVITAVIPKARLEKLLKGSGGSRW